MAKTYNLTTGVRAPRPRSKRLRGLASSSSTTTNIGTTGDGGFSAFMAKLREMFILVDGDGNEVTNVDDAVAVKVANGLSLVSEGEITAFVASTE